mmetsp:Transcript_73106/g.161352  ORF Transcript_73106/g.161352 Transcript_73106/m.161352 type:complete len:290 (+) Transcript_73106:2149-3018(+)
MQALLRRLAEVYYSAVDTRASLCQACASLCNFTFSFQLLFCGCELLEHIEKLLSFLLQLLLFLSTALYRTTHLDELFRTLVLQCCTTLHCGTGATLCLTELLQTLSEVTLACSGISHITFSLNSFLTDNLDLMVQLAQSISTCRGDLLGFLLDAFKLLKLVGCESDGAICQAFLQGLLLRLQPCFFSPDSCELFLELVAPLSVLFCRMREFLQPLLQKGKSALDGDALRMEALKLCLHCSHLLFNLLCRKMCFGSLAIRCLHLSFLGFHVLTNFLAILHSHRASVGGTL